MSCWKQLHQRGILKKEEVVVVSVCYQTPGKRRTAESIIHSISNSLIDGSSNEGSDHLQASYWKQEVKHLWNLFFLFEEKPN